MPSRRYMVYVCVAVVIVAQCVCALDASAYSSPHWPKDDEDLAKRLVHSEVCSKPQAQVQ